MLQCPFCFRFIANDQMFDHVSHKHPTANLEQFIGGLKPFQKVSCPCKIEQQGIKLDSKVAAKLFLKHYFSHFETDKFRFIDEELIDLPLPTMCLLKVMEKVDFLLHFDYDLLIKVVVGDDTQ